MNDISVDKILNLDKWQIVQDSIASSTKLAIVTVDYKGVPITQHSRCSSFCDAIRKDGNITKLCQKCDSRGGLESVRQNKPFVYLCHYDIVDIAIPIIINNNYVGAVLAGQVRLKDDSSLERIVNLSSDVSLLDDDTIKLYNKLPRLSYDDIMDSADMLHKICNYILEESLSKNLLIEMYERIYKVDPISSSDTNNGYPLETLQKLKSQITSVMTHSYMTHSSEKGNIKNPILRPALEYIHAHPQENITLASLANICNISRGYFSRVFLSETGETFTTYLTKIRIKLACNMLTQTQVSITEISDNLGYSDPSYFNRTFKKIEGVTPAIYRRLNR